MGGRGAGAGLKVSWVDAPAALNFPPFTSISPVSPRSPSLSPIAPIFPRPGARLGDIGAGDVGGLQWLYLHIATPEILTEND